MYLHACLPIRVDIGGTGTGHRLGRFVGLSVHVGNLGRMVIFGYFRLLLVIFGYFRLFLVIFGYFRLCLVIYGIVPAPGQPLRGGGRQAS